jgi:hypothetical protein
MDLLGDDAVALVPRDMKHYRVELCHLVDRGQVIRITAHEPRVECEFTLDAVAACWLRDHIQPEDRVTFARSEQMSEIRTEWTGVDVLRDPDLAASMWQS